jgi:SAM-dependent methyltransferase
MAEEYDSLTAGHYFAYRPPLHKLILDKCIRSKVTLGLDIGCGTGHSSIALTHYCKQVIGIDPSAAMLADAITHPQVEYQMYDGKELEFQINTFELITFAGSLYYAKSQELLNEFIRVSRQGAKIVVYDFEIILDQVLADLEIGLVPNRVSNYNHRENFSGLDLEHLEVVMELSDMATIEVDSSDLAHLLLSSKNNYNLLNNTYGDQNLFGKVLSQLNRNSDGEKHNLSANIYYSVYRCKK